MDAPRFDALARVLSANTRRGLLGLGLGLPLLGGLLTILEAEDAAAKKRGKKKRKKRKKKKCKKQRRTICNGRCGIVKDKCKKTIDCGACAPCGDVCASGCPFTSVQAAINAASDGDTIRLCAGTYQEAAELVIDKNLTLLGAGEGETGTILDGQEQHRVVHVFAGTTVALQGLRLTGGSAGLDGGGGILNIGGQLTLTGCTVIDNATAGNGGGLHNDIGGEMTLTDCTVSGNTANGLSGGIENAGTLSLTDSTVSGNTATGLGGGIGNNLGTLTLTDSTVSDNTAGGNGGGIDNFHGTVILTDSTVSGNTAASSGGGIENIQGTLILTDSTVSGNTANNVGGGIVNFGDGTVSLEGDSHVCDNEPDQCWGFSDPACMETCP